MNRLTKHINLVLISSSLVLHGCRGWHEEEEKQDPQQQQQQGGGHGGTHTSHSTHFFPFFFGGSTRPGRTVSPGIRSGATPSTGRSSIGGSARGGFGVSAHGASS